MSATQSEDTRVESTGRAWSIAKMWSVVTQRDVTAESKRPRFEVAVGEHFSSLYFRTEADATAFALAAIPEGKGLIYAALTIEQDYPCPYDLIREHDGSYRLITLDGARWVSRPFPVEDSELITN